VVIVSVFILDKLHAVLWFAIPFVVVLALAFGAFALAGALRIPSWHRARRRAREYIAENGGKFPPDLRWYT